MAPSPRLEVEERGAAERSPSRAIVGHPKLGPSRAAVGCPKLDPSCVAVGRQEMGESEMYREKLRKRGGCERTLG